MRASVASTEAELSEVPRLGVTGALLIILALHILIIAAIFINAKTTSGGKATAGGSASSKGSASGGNSPSYLTVESDLTSLERSTPYHFIQMGDTYAHVAQKHGVDESELRRINKNETLKSGRILRLPPRKVVAMNDPEIERLRLNGRNGRETALVKPLVRYQDVSEVPVSRAHLHPVIDDSAAVAPRVENRSVAPRAAVAPVDQKSLLRANNSLDPRKLQVGMKLVVPAR